jgi:hypothetical protein
MGRSLEKFAQVPGCNDDFRRAHDDQCNELLTSVEVSYERFRTKSCFLLRGSPPVWLSSAISMQSMTVLGLSKFWMLEASPSKSNGADGRTDRVRMATQLLKYSTTQLLNYSNTQLLKYSNPYLQHFKNNLLHKTSQLNIGCCWFHHCALAKL